MILDARDKPIITLLEKIRYMLMTRMQANRDKSIKWSSDDICPRIKNVLCKSQVVAAEYIPRKSNEWNYELIGASITDIWAVDLLNRKCSCRKWNLTGLPCKHAISAIWAKNDEISSYIDDCYKVETYRRIYEFVILPMNGQSMWSQHENIPPLPPRVVRQSTKGRKQKKRRKESDEVGASRTKVKRKQKYLGCSRCHKLGHNTRTCKYNLLQTESQNVSPLYHEYLHHVLLQNYQLEELQRVKLISTQQSDVLS
ncbi:uncharacterized protein LOC125835950 [Solanum verrucosum]|uniref:uncharacterized protein LOC125835950 n=1 Tax=Solanum verrucosum TaxID=315347 RepID=UPI0020D011B7|nr:uncharacterized protein LOC125835950 [Solanum verrucosum]